MSFSGTDLHCFSISGDRYFLLKSNEWSERMGSKVVALLSDAGKPAEAAAGLKKQSLMFQNLRGLKRGIIRLQRRMRVSSVGIVERRC